MDLNIATEDELSEVIAEKLLREKNNRVNILNKFRKGGFGYLYSKMDSWQKISKQIPVFIFTDLDTLECAPSLIEKWCRGIPLGDNLHIRVAVREVESWLLADKEAMRVLIGGKGNIPNRPDELNDPKLELLKLANKASRDVRLDLVSQTSSSLKQGLGYNARLISYVQGLWSPERAADNSPSLQRTRSRLESLLSSK
jgi:hypothetical protein